MKLPKQSAPVERNITGAAISSQSGVEASVPWGALLTGASLIPTVVDFFKK
jgi:hypothetical protein